MFYLDPIPFAAIEGQVQIRADVFPATVAFSFAVNPYNRSRAIVTADRVLVLVDGQRTPRVLYDGGLNNVSGDRNQMVASTDDGEVTITRARGCGCGSRLRSFKPYRSSVRMAAR